MGTEKSLQTKKAEMAKILIKIDALKFGIFKLTSGKNSPYYIDLRIVPSFPDAFTEICDFYSEQITNQIGIKNFDRIAGVPIAGMPFASQIAYNLKKPFLYVRKGQRRHGRQRRVEGILVSGDRVLLIDDLVTTGLSLRKAADAIRAEGGVVTQAVAFLDREEGGREKLAKEGIQLHSLLKIDEVAKILYETDAIDEESYKTITKQIKKAKV
ncbi:MAG TPA: orotate phosphoribosyltransferase [Candidatus Sulfotelmatobacter sp.]|nr:orotate phosphoribosyltransferase [Candidatus Sulfotelmatobacter sp.]